MVLEIFSKNIFAQMKVRNSSITQNFWSLFLKKRKGWVLKFSGNQLHDDFDTGLNKQWDTDHKATTIFQENEWH